MYRIGVPVINNRIKRQNREKILFQLKKTDATTVLLALGEYITDPDAFSRELDELKDNCAFFHSHGLSVGVWTWTFMMHGNHPYTTMQGPLGTSNSSIVCPSDDKFRKFATEYIKKLASCGVDLILFDDDFRYGHTVFGCLCKNHISRMEQTLGESLENNFLDPYLLSGGENKYRSAWVEAKGHFFRLFAKEMRDAVDCVNPNVRIGVCACMSLWDHDGVDAAEIARILAGNTKPFLRLIGAPYWAVNKYWGNRLQNVIELSRMERSWCGDDIEIYAEGDVYPRPRTNCPANYLELFDLAMRADGTMDGLLKYVQDYHGNAEYETGYVKFHEKNKPLYEKTHRIFDGKEPCGVRVYMKKNRYEKMNIPDTIQGTTQVEDTFFSIEGRMLSDNSIPSVYEGLGIAGIAFADNAELLTKEAMKRGVILDAAAARVLMKKGIDVGIEAIGDEVNVIMEHFEKNNEFTALSCRAYDFSLNSNAEILSTFIYQNQTLDCNGLGYEPENAIVGAYRYTNKQGYQFIVFSFDAYFNGEGIYRSYARSKQLATTIESFGNGCLPAYTYGNPDLYLLTKKDDSSMSVGLWNIFADPVLKPVIELDRTYSNVHFVNCTGKLDGNRVLLDELPAFSYAAFEVK